MRKIENNLLYPVSAAINSQVFDIAASTEPGPVGDRFLNLLAGGDIVLRTHGAGSIGAALGEYTLALPDLSGLSAAERANIFDALPEAEKALLSRTHAGEMAGVYHTLYRYIGPQGSVALDRAGVDFSDASLWQAFTPTFSNDPSLRLGQSLAAHSTLQFLSAEHFGLYQSSSALFVYNSQLLDGASGADRLALQNRIAQAQAQGLLVVDIGSGALNPVWQAVAVGFMAQDGAGAQWLQTGALVGDMRDPRYLTIERTRSLAVHSEHGVVSAYSQTTVGLDAPRGDIRLGDIHATEGISVSVSAKGGSIVGTAAGTLQSQGKVSLVADKDIVGSRLDANGLPVYDASQHLQLHLGNGHALYLEAGGIARVAQQGTVDMNLVLASTGGTDSAGSSYQAGADLRIGQVLSASSVTFTAGGSIVNATAQGQRQHANVTLTALSEQQQAGLAGPREVVLIAGQAVGALGADLSQAGQPILLNIAPNDAQARVRAQAAAGINLYGLHSLRLAGLEALDGNGQRGDVRVEALDGLFNGTAAGQAAITARHAWLGSLNGAIGAAGQPLAVDLSGSLGASAWGAVAISQLGAHDLQLSQVESRSRDEIRLASQTNIVNDKSAHPGLSSGRDLPVVIGGSLYFQAGGAVGRHVLADVDGSARNDALIVAAVGAGATVNAQTGAGLALVQVAQASDAQGQLQSLSLNLGRIEAGDAWLVARRSASGAGGDIQLGADSVITVAGVASLLAGGNLALAGSAGALPGAVISAGQRLALRADRDDQGAKGRPVSVVIGGRLLAPVVQIHGSETADNFLHLGAGAEIGGAQHAGGGVSPGQRLEVTGGAGQDHILVQARIHQQEVRLDSLGGDDQVRLEAAQLWGDLHIQAGTGDNQVALVDSLLHGRLDVTTGHGNNRVHLERTTVDGDARIATGDGRDRIELSLAAFAGHLRVDAGANDDVIWMDRMLLGSGAVVRGGAGDDYIYLSARALAGNVTLLGEAGNDLIVLDQLPSLTSQQSAPGVTDRVRVDGGQGNDQTIVNLSAALTALLIDVQDTNADGTPNLAEVNRLTINGTAEDETFLLREHFVAKLTQQGAGYAQAVQRVNYDRSMTGGLRLNGVDGGNRFYIDGSSTQVSIDGGLGSDPGRLNLFQIGQLFALDRLLPQVAAGDEIGTLQTTQGYLSGGNGFGMSIHGAQGSSNVFKVYSNAAPLALYGGGRDDEFMVYAFLQADGGYVDNSLVSLEGGGGVNRFTLLGSDGDDAFVVTQDGIRGAGLNTRYQQIQQVQLDARAGNDHIYVLSTRSNVITTLIGGQGSDTFDLGGDVAPHSVVSGGMAQGPLDGRQPVRITAAPGLLDAGSTVSLSVELDTSLLPRPASGQAYVSLTGAMLASALYGSLAQGTGLAATDLATALQGLQGRGLLLSSDGGLTWQQSVVLAFDAQGAGALAWGAARQVLVKFEDGSGLGLPPLGLTGPGLAGQDLHLSASLFTTLPGWHDRALAPITLSVASGGTAAAGGAQPRATDQPVISVDPVTGVRYVQYPDQPHDLSGIQGSLLIEGGTPDRLNALEDLRAGVGLPSERDGVLALGSAAPGPADKDRLRLFDDGTLSGRTGLQDQATHTDGLGRLYANPQASDFGRITGLGMASGLGDAAGSLLLGGYRYDQGVLFHGLQSVNTMLGQGDDTWTVRHAPEGTVTLVQGGGGNNRLIAEGSTLGGTQRPVLLFGSTSQDGRDYTAQPGQREAGKALQFGAAGNNLLDARGTTQGVILYGGAGDDQIYGGSGNDLIAGGGGSNTIAAGQGNNLVFGSAGLNVDLGDQGSLDALVLVLTSEQAAAGAQGPNADRLQTGGNHITAGDGNNIVFAHFGRIVSAAPLNYLRNRSDFIDAAAPGGEARYLTGTGLLALENLPAPSAGANYISVGAGRNVLFGDLGDDRIRAGGGFNLLAGDAAVAHFTAAGRILGFSSAWIDRGGNDRLENQGTGVMLGGFGNDYLQSGAGDNLLQGDNGRVVFVNDRFRLIESTGLALGGTDTLLAGPGRNILIAGGGADMLGGSFGKDAMVGDYAAIYLDPLTGRIVNLTRFGLGGNAPDLIARSMADLFSEPAHWGQGARPALLAARVAHEGGGQAVGRLSAQMVKLRADDGHGALPLRQVLSGEAMFQRDGPAPTDRSPLALPADQGADIAAGGTHENLDESADENLADGASDAAARPPAPDQPAWQAAGVGLLGLGAALGVAAAVVFNSKTNAWQAKARRPGGPRVVRPAGTVQEAAQASTENE